jgi:hypothetical protein
VVMTVTNHGVPQIAGYVCNLHAGPCFMQLVITQDLATGHYITSMLDESTIHPHIPLN